MWKRACGGGLAAVVATVLGPGRNVVWASSTALFWIVTVAAGLCVVAAAWVLSVAFREDRAEVGFLGAAFMSVSVLPLVHGLTAPGVLYGPNKAVMTSAYASLPLAVAAGAPLLLRRSDLVRRLTRRWRVWTSCWCAVSFGLAAFLLLRPNSVMVPGPRHPVTLVLLAFSLFGGLTLSRRQLRLHELAGQRSYLVASLALLSLGLTSIVWLGDRPFSSGWWLVHALDIGGVFAGTFSVARGHHLGTSVVELLAPVIAHDPLVAFEAGLAPAVHRLVASLERKDRITRDHVVRTAEIAIATGDRLGLDGNRLRYLGLAALLHDIGKLEVPDHILNKPGRLDPAEFERMKQHTVDGGRILAAIPLLAPCARIVRAHHERMDGQGYPDRKSGNSIPLEARIISVCDAFDAMANTRQYRTGMGTEKAIAILREHAGSQWDDEVVELVVALVTRSVDQEADPRLDAVGREEEDLAALAQHSDQCGCLDALPEPVQGLLVAV